MKKIARGDIQRAVQVLRDGGVIAIPTETVYGLACDPRNAEAVRKIFKIKGRAETKPLQLIASSFAQVQRLADLHVEELKIAKRYWPGPLTLLVNLKTGINLATHVSPKGIIGIRVTSSPIAASIVRAFGHPIAATSANRSGSLPAPSSDVVFEAFASFKHKPDFILEAGKIPMNPPTTVASIDKDGHVTIYREGAIKL